MGLALAAAPSELHMLTVRAPHPSIDLAVAADDTDIRFQAPTELMLAHAEQVLARNPGMTAQALLQRFAKDIRELNGDPCKEEFNPDTEIMKIEAQYGLIQKLSALPKQAGGAASKVNAGGRGGAAPLRRTRRKSKRGKKRSGRR